ncbi:MAG: YerC/YecD family TrpR-related protein [Saccharofermentanales bacterium]
MNEKLREPIKDLFFRAILNLENIDECYSFFEDICTIPELNSISQRLQVAIMLKQGMTYTQISEKTKVSSATISRVNRALEYGADGYKTALERLDKQGSIAGRKEMFN